MGSIIMGSLGSVGYHYSSSDYSTLWAKTQHYSASDTAISLQTPDDPAMVLIGMWGGERHEER